MPRLVRTMLSMPILIFFSPLTSADSAEVPLDRFSKMLGRPNRPIRVPMKEAMVTVDSARLLQKLI